MIQIKLCIFCFDKDKRSTKFIWNIFSKISPHTKLLRRIFIQFSSSRTKCTRPMHHRSIRKFLGDKYSLRRRRLSILSYFSYFLQRRTRNEHRHVFDHPHASASSPCKCTHALSVRAPKVHIARWLIYGLWEFRIAAINQNYGIFGIVQTNISCLVPIRLCSGRTVVSANKAIFRVLCVVLMFSNESVIIFLIGYL